MLNTTSWNNEPGNASIFATPDFMLDHSTSDVLDRIPAHGITETRMPERPYVYGRSTTYARRLLLRNTPTLKFPL